MSPTLPAYASGTFTIGERTVHRLGFGTMRLTGPGIWDEPVDRAECVAVVRRAVEPGRRSHRYRRFVRASGQ